MPAREQSQLPTLVRGWGFPLTNPPRETLLHHCAGESLTKLFVRPSHWLVPAFPKWLPVNSGGLEAPRRTRYLGKCPRQPVTRRHAVLCTFDAVPGPNS